ncbi:hypothetical protein QOZ80_3BG0284930 [Eleusine coracana subsp. coracana]|nr:hypothetical protein QOZ80_3BG0284930 [Eleusine coracana subsp. coracana]
MQGIKGKVSVSKVHIYESDGDLNHDLADPPMMDSSDEASYDEDDEGEALRKKSKYQRYDSKNEMPKFCLGMTFRDRKQCKKALIKYGLAIRRHLMFPKDEKNRIRAKCSWPNCHWVIFVSSPSPTAWYQVKTYNDVHICPKRKENRLVTARRIADKYESIIKANPS